jgi:iron complex transport system substrate-binding protein
MRGVSFTLRRRALACVVLALALVPHGARQPGARPAWAEASPPRRIVSLGPAATEILFALGAGHLVIGVCDFCDHPAEVRALPRVGAFTNPSVESIVALAPDLVIGVHGPATIESLATVERLGMDVLVVSDTTLDAVWAAIRDIGRRTGTTPAAAGLEATMRARFDAVRARVAGAPRRRVLAVVGQTPLVVAGKGTFVDDLIDIAGGVNVAGDTAQPWPMLSLEAAVARAPEVVIDSAVGHEGGADAGLWARFPTLPAVRDGRVHAYESFDALRGGPRLVDAAEEFARLIHPERAGPMPGRDVPSTAAAAGGPSTTGAPRGGVGRERRP